MPCTDSRGPRGFFGFCGGRVGVRYGSEVIDGGGKGVGEEGDEGWDVNIECFDVRSEEGGCFAAFYAVTGVVDVFTDLASWSLQVKYNNSDDVSVLYHPPNFHQR